MDKREELGERTVRILELTKKQSEKYGKERKILDNFLREFREDDEYITEWESYLNKFELELSVIWNKEYWWLQYSYFYEKKNIEQSKN